MSIHPQGEALRNAIKYVSEEKLANPEASINLLIQKAGMKFDLTPKDAQFLEGFYKDSNDLKRSPCGQD